jgi:hypothetical protein
MPHLKIRSEKILQTGSPLRALTIAESNNQDWDSEMKDTKKVSFCDITVIISVLYATCNLKQQHIC